VDGADIVLEVGDGQAEEVLEIGRLAGYVPLGYLPGPVRDTPGGAGALGFGVRYVSVAEAGDLLREGRVGTRTHRNGRRARSGGGRSVAAVRGQVPRSRQAHRRALRIR
jgi:hypothetical protein